MVVVILGISVGVGGIHRMATWLSGWRLLFKRNQAPCYKHGSANSSYRWYDMHSST
jgi:hypothetical protein